MNHPEKTTRRAFIGGMSAGAAALSLGGGCKSRGDSRMAALPPGPPLVQNESGVFVLPKLPYAMDALQPHHSKETLTYHYGKHHAGYVAKLNAKTKGTPLGSRSLEEVILASQKVPGIFNNAAQIWNHAFYWHSLSPDGGGEPKGAAAKAIAGCFGGFETFKKQFTEKAATLFGSGWAWLVKKSDGKLDIVQTGNAGTPLTEGLVPVLTCDVWEHAYYIDYRNARKKYIEAFWNLVNWEFVGKNLG